LWKQLQHAWVPALGSTGETLRDVVGDADGVLTNMSPGTDWAPSGKMGIVLNSDDADEQVVVSSSHLDNWSTNTWTVSIWARVDSLNGSGAAEAFLIGKTIGGTWASCWDIHIDSDNLIWRILTTQPATETATKTGFSTAYLGKWIHVVGIHSGNSSSEDQSLWVNGDKVATNISAPSPVKNGVGDLAIAGSLSSALGSRFTLDGAVGPAMMWDRTLDQTEIRQLYRDPLAPFRQRRFLPTYSPVAEEAAATTSVGWTRSLTPSPVRPSYKSGFARSAAESSSPGLWPDHAWCPTLGATGEVVHDVAGFLDGTLATGMDPASDWVASKFGPVIAFDGASDDITVGTGVTEAIQAASALSITMRIFCTDSASDNALFGSWPNNFLLWRDENGGSDRYGFATKDPVPTITYGSNASAKTNQWQTVTVVYNTVANDCSLWIDGVSDTVTGGSAPTITGTAQSAAIGADFSGDNSRVFNGRIAETLLHHRVLAPSEIRQLHSDPLAPFRQRRFTPTISGAAAAGWQPYWGLHATRFAGILT